MTPQEVERAGAWAATLAVALHDVAGEVGAVSRRLAAAWPDDHGREWGERLQALRTTLERDADAAVSLGQAAERAAGPRLGGTGARRADDERGVRIARLDDPAG